MGSHLKLIGSCKNVCFFLLSLCFTNPPFYEMGVCTLSNHNLEFHHICNCNKYLFHQTSFPCPCFSMIFTLYIAPNERVHVKAYIYFLLFQIIIVNYLPTMTRYMKCFILLLSTLSSNISIAVFAGIALITHIRLLNIITS